MSAWLQQFIDFRLTAFCRRGSRPITVCNTTLLREPKNMCIKFQQVTQIKSSSLLKLALAPMDGQADSHPRFNSSRRPDYLYMYNSISISISFIIS